MFEEQVDEPLGPFQWETYWERNLIVMHALHERPLLAFTGTGNTAGAVFPATQLHVGQIQEGYQNDSYSQGQSMFFNVMRKQACCGG
jgi:hypothetical protein